MPVTHNNQPLEKVLNYMLSQQKSTSNKPSRFMEALDTWTEDTIINPLSKVWEKHQANPETKAATEEVEEAVDNIKKAIRAKVLESYRNGQGATSKNASKSYQPRR